MNKQQALQQLGLSEGASLQAINTAYQEKSTTIEEKLSAAPTEGLKEKFIKMQASLQQAQQILLNDTTETSAHSPLSQTKLADLPGIGATAGAQLNLQTGQTLAERYKIEEQIGAGGMGAVYRAFDNNTGKEIALKVLLPELFKHQSAKQRFLDEARLSQQLSHPNIVNVYDVQQQGEYYFLTMELLEGQDLRQVMENRKLARQPFAIDEVQEIIAAISEGLAYAHKYTVHRDIKPENIWLTEEGDYKLMDFGIAQVQSTSQRTQTGAAMGTAYYMAPEQLKGAKNIDGRADQYALAVLAYELLSGEVPAGMIEPIKQHRKDTPKATANAIHKALSPRPENRFDKTESFNTAIAGKSKGSSLPSFPLKGIGIAAVLLLAIGGIGKLAIDGQFDDLLQALKPIDKEVIAKQKAEVSRSLGEIKTYKQRLETARRNLNSDVRDAERNNSTQLKALQYWQKTTEGNLFAGSKITELEGELSVAETLLREEAFGQAQQSMNTVRDGYKTLWNEFTAAEQLYQVERNSQKIRDNWLVVKQRDKLGDTDAKNADTFYKQAKQALLIGEINKALSSYKKFISAYQTLFDQVKTITQTRQQARQAKEKWLQRKENYSLSDQGTEEKANHAVDQALQAEQRGELKQALNHYQQAQQYWDDTYSSVSSKVDEIDKQRAARARELAKIHTKTFKVKGKTYTYKGQLKDGKKHGKGTETRADGYKYVGQFKDGKEHGKGTITWGNGNKYVGQFKDGKGYGKGTFTWANGSKYAGQIKDDKQHGKGTLTKPNGYKYVGQYKDDKLHGKGTSTWASGNKYVGQYKDDNIHGKGEYYFAKSGNLFSSEWIDNENSHWGTVKYRNGTTAKRRVVDNILGNK